MQILREISSGLWCAEASGRAYGVELGERMTVVRLDGGELFLHGAIPLSSTLRRELDALGTVRHLCVPNLRCFDHLPQWIDAYPSAERWAPPGASWTAVVTNVRSMPRTLTTLS